MIFVTVGTHEQQFNRLIEYVDKLKENGFIDDEVIMQTGFSTYEPKYCKWSNLFPYKEILNYVENARIIITHGGPASFIMPLQVGKIPIVVPRQLEFDEHVNNHQVEFATALQQRQGNIISINKIEDLEQIIKNYDSIVSQKNANIHSNNENFCLELGRIVEAMMV